MKFVDAAMKKAKSTDKEKVIKAMEGITIDSYWGPMTVRDFDHQVTSGQLWAPLVKKGSQPYYLLDGTKAKYMPCTKDLFTKEEWLAKRKAAGK
jgi:ABC-type branched-subunit amino acid transport system substrate-binding protein